MEEIKKIEVQGQQYGVADMLMRSVMGGNAQTITLDHTSNMNNYKDAGTYRIKGERTGNPLSDNLPVMNQGSGHTIDAVLVVLDSSLTNGTGKEDDCTITQFLMLSNRVGGQEGDMYMRSGFGANKDNLTWKPWEKYQTNVEVGCVSDGYTLNPSNPTQVLNPGYGMNDITDNGIYSGVYIPPRIIAEDSPLGLEIADPTGIETFVMVVINNYAAASNVRCITQVKFAVTNGGVFSMEKRSTTPGTTDAWSEWESVGGVGTVDQQLDGYSKNAVANAAVYKQFYAQQEEIKKCATKDNLAKGLDWEANTTKEFHIKNRTHHMKDYLCKYFTGSPIAISKPSDTGYVVIAYDTDGDAKYLKVEIKANEYKTEEFLDAMGLPIIFTWDNGASTINVQSFSGSLEKLCMRAYYSSSATSFDDYFVKLDEGFLPSIGGTEIGGKNYLGVIASSEIAKDVTLKSGTYYGLASDLDNRPFVLEVSNNYDDNPSMAETDKKGFKILRCYPPYDEDGFTYSATATEHTTIGYYSYGQQKFWYGNFVQTNTQVVKYTFLPLRSTTHQTMVWGSQHLLEYLETAEIPEKGAKIYNHIIEKAKTLKVEHITIHATPSQCWSGGSGLDGYSVVEVLYADAASALADSVPVCYERLMYDADSNKGYLIQTITEFEELQ